MAEPLLGSPTLPAAEVDFAIRQEMAVNVKDFLLRRSGMYWLVAVERVNPASGLMNGVG